MAVSDTDSKGLSCPLGSEFELDLLKDPWRPGLTSTAATILVLLAGAGAGSLFLGASSAAAAPVTCAAGTCSLTFGQAGAATQEWEVPNGLSEAAFVVNGAGGGSDTYGGNGGPGGNGAQVTATIPVTGGDSLQLLVGTGGERTESSQGAAGGYGGGGDGGTGIELGAGGYGFENFNEESQEVPAEPGSITISFTQPTTGTSLAASSLSPTVGTPVTLTATVSSAPDSGTVAFKDGAGTIAGCGAVTVDVTVTTTTASSAGVSTSPPPQTPLPTAPLVAAPPSPVFALSILTREAKPLLNRHVLAVRARCGTVSCAVRARMTVKLSGGGKVLTVSSATTMLPAGEAGNALFAVPSKLRGTVRSYLLHHPHATATLQVTYTASAAGHPSQTAHVALAVSTYGGYR
jgi:hypothetical protein